MQGAKTQLMPRRRFGPLRVNTRICCLLADCSTPLCSRPQILPISTAYAVCEGLGLESGLDKKFHEAPVFYWLYTLLIVAGASVVLIPRLPLVYVSVLSQVANGVVLPIVLVFMLLLTNDRELMGE